MFTVMLFHTDVTAKSYSKYKYHDLIIIIIIMCFVGLIQLG